MATTSKALPKFEVPTTPAPTKLLALDMKTILVNLEGITPFICHNWDDKNIKKMQEKHAGTASKGREKRNPAAEYEAAYYRLPDGRPGMKVIAFKNAAVTAVTSLGKEFTKVGARQGAAWLGEARQAWLGTTGRGSAWPVRVGQAWRG